MFIVTYPKCGTTWIEQCVLLLQHRGDVSKMNPSTKNTYTPIRTASASSSGEGGGKGGTSSSSGKIWPEACIEQNPSIFLQSGPEFFLLSINEFDQAPSPRILKSHALLITGRGSPSHLSGSGCSSGGDESKEEFALPEGVKVIIVTRNPLDACVSSYYHAWNPCKVGTYYVQFPLTLFE